MSNARIYKKEGSILYSIQNKDIDYLSEYVMSERINF